MSGNGRKRARRRIVYRGSSQNRLSMILVVTVMAAILIAVSVRGVYLNSKLSEYNEQIEELEAEIESENERTEEIEEYAKYVQTDEYVEEVARDKLGLVKEGEIIFRNDTDSVTDGSQASAESSEDADAAALEETSEETEDAVSSEALSGEIQQETGTAVQ